MVMNSKLLKPWILVSVLMLLAARVAMAGSVTGSSELGVAMKELSSLQGFSCKFEQTISYAEGGERSYLGEIAVSRPGKFRWHYTKPYEQLYVSNGDGIWLYEPDLMQAQRMQDLGEVQPVVLQLLDGKVSLDDIEILDKALLDAGITVWHVRIGREKSAAEVWLAIAQSHLQWIESKDMLLNKNRLRLFDVVKQQPDNEFFEFIAPEGVDVIGAL